MPKSEVRSAISKILMDNATIFHSRELYAFMDGWGGMPKI